MWHRKRGLYLKSRLRGGVKVEHVARGGRRGGVRADGDTSFRLAEGRGVEELGGSLEAVCLWEGFSHCVQTDSNSLEKEWMSAELFAIVKSEESMKVQWRYLQEELCVGVSGAKQHSAGS